MHSHSALGLFLPARAKRGSAETAAGAVRATRTSSRMLKSISSAVSAHPLHKTTATCHKTCVRHAKACSSHQKKHVKYSRAKLKGANFSLLLGVRSRCLWLSGETKLKSYNCTFNRARSAIQPTHILAQEESEQGLPLAGTNLTTPLTTVQFSGACSSLSAHSPGTPVSGVNWSPQSGIYW